MMLCQGIKNSTIVRNPSGKQIEPFPNFLRLLRAGIICVLRLLDNKAHIGQRAMATNPVSLILVLGKFALEEFDGIRVSPSGYIRRATVQSVQDSDREGRKVPTLQVMLAGTRPRRLAV